MNEELGQVQYRDGFYGDIVGGYAYTSNGLNVSIVNAGVSLPVGTVPGMSTGMFSATGGYLFSLNDAWSVSPTVRYVGLSGNDATSNANYRTGTAATAQISYWTNMGLVGLATTYDGFSHVQVGGNVGLGVVDVSGEAQTNIVEAAGTTSFNWVNYSDIGLGYNAGVSAGYAYSLRTFLYAAVDYVGANLAVSATSNTIAVETARYTLDQQNTLLVGLGVRIHY